MFTLELLLLALLSVFSLAVPTPNSSQIPLQPPARLKPNTTRIRPLVLWHGLGDSHSSPGMLEFAEMIKGEHPGIFIHSIYIEENLDADQRAGFFGNVNLQLEDVAEQLAGIEELGDGFDAIGFSQGGQFLRAYVERYNSPPIHNLITFGAQHMGIADIPLCRPGDIPCQLARRAARAGVYTGWAQSNLVQAQYFRDPDQLPAYYLTNTFLKSINNEVAESANATYFKNFVTLSKFVLVLFTEDKTVVPKESAWFGSYATSTEDGMEHQSIIPMRLQPVYVQDTFGLRTLDEGGNVKLVACEGEHMRLSKECWQPLVQKYVGGEL